MTWWLRTLARDLLGVLVGEGYQGIPGGLVRFDVRVRWLHDRHGNQWCVSCRCVACGARRSAIWPVRRMVMHVARVHGAEA